MKKKLSKVLAGVLTAAMMLSGISGPAAAADAESAASSAVTGETGLFEEKDTEESGESALRKSEEPEKSGETSGNEKEAGTSSGEEAPSESIGEQNTEGEEQNTSSEETAAAAPAESGSPAEEDPGTQLPEEAGEPDTGLYTADSEAAAAESAGDSTIELALTNNVKMFKPSSASLAVSGEAGSADYDAVLSLTMANTSYSKVYVGSKEAAESASEGVVSLDSSNTFTFSVKDILETPTVISFYSARGGKWNERQVTVSLTNKSIVFDNVTVAVTGITLDETSIELSVGDTKALTATVEPSDAADKTVTWSSSDETVAGVDASGTVTAAAKGTAEITATAGDGKTKATCTVTVSDPSESQSYTADVTAGDTAYTLNGAYVTKQADGTYLLKGYYYGRQGRNIIAMGSASEAKAGTAKMYKAELVKENGENHYYFTIPLEKLDTEYTVSFSCDGSDSTPNALLSQDLVRLGTWNETTIKVDTSSLQETDQEALTESSTEFIPVTNVTIEYNGETISSASPAKMGSISDIEPGSSFTLSATVTPANATNASQVTWALGAASRRYARYITVGSDGTVTIQEGITANNAIQVQAKAGSGNNAWTATVNILLAVPADSISLDQTELSLEAQETASLTATLSPDNTSRTASDITWTSSDESVATVDKNGTVTAVSKGEATITAKVDDASAECRVTVTTDAQQLEDGQYSVSLTSSLGMFHFENPVTASVDGDKAVLHIVSTTDKARYDQMYLGTYKDDISDSEAVKGVYDSETGYYTFDVTVPASSLVQGNRIYYVLRYREGYSAKHSGDWYKASSDYYFTVGESSAETTPAPEATATPTPTPEATATPTPEATATPTPTPEATATPAPAGTVSLTPVNNATMFNVVSASVGTSNGERVLTFALNGKGYEQLFKGNVSSAEKSTASQQISYSQNSAGKYEFRIPLSANENRFLLSAQSKRLGKWYGRKMTIDLAAKTLTVEDEEDDDAVITPEPTQAPDATATPTPTPTAAPTPTKAVSNTNGTTSAVNNSTGLADGTYTPDSFSFSGGSGKAHITCTKITIRGGKAYATIVFSSNKYIYVKADGKQYNGSGTFEIPVSLNQNFTIIGCTTAMSVPHEITYTLYIGLKAAQNADSGSGTAAETTLAEDTKTMDTEAPEIAGLTSTGETEVKYAELFRIFNYNQGISLIEVDMVKYTGRDETENPETAKAIEEAEAAAKAESASADDSDGEESDSSQTDATDAQLVEDLYDHDIVKYLVVPADVELPAGLDKEVIVIRKPADHSYVSSENALSFIDELGETGQIKTVGMEADEITVSSVRDAMNETGDGAISFAGPYDDWSYRDFVLNSTNLAIEDPRILPQADDVTDSEGNTLTPEEQMTRYSDLVLHAVQLDVPMICDRSGDEKTDEAKADWKLVYEVLFS